jgi:vitamin B12 transporter
MRKIYTLSLLSMLIISVTAPAQDSTKVTMLRAVAISATRTEQPLIEIPRSVTVITSDVIEKSAYSSLGDLLNAETGLYVVGAGQTPGTNQNVFMRGASSNQLAVLVDGVRVTDPSSPNSAIDLSEISLTNVDRVEIIRGSHSTMYGGAAIGGVINIITKEKPQSGLHGNASWQGDLFRNGGASSTENLNLHYSMHSGVYFTGSAFQGNVRGLDASDKTGLSTFSADRDGFRKSDGLIKAGFKDERWDAYVSFKNVHQHTDIDNAAYADDDNYYLLFDRRFWQYKLARTWAKRWSISALGSFSGHERFYENDSSKVSETAYDMAYSRGTYHGKLQTHEIQINYHRDRITGMLGAGLYHEKMFFDNYFFFNDPAFPFESTTNYDTINSRATTGYMFAQLGYRAGLFQVTAGSRVSRHSMAGNFATFEVNPSLKFGDLLVYGSVSTGFNAPSLYQLFDPSKGFSAYTTRGNRNLKPERSLSLEVGAKKEFTSGSYVTLSGYRTRVTDAIEYVYLWNGTTPIESLGFSDDRGDTYINTGENVAVGIELEAFAQFTDHLFLKANFSSLSTRVLVRPGDVDAAQTGGHHVELYNLGAFLDGDFEQEHLLRRPDLRGNISLGYRFPFDITAIASYRYTGQRYDAGYDATVSPYGGLSRLKVDGYHLVDLAARWQATSTVSIALAVENILDQKYREVAGFQTRGRGLYLKAMYRW